MRKNTRKELKNTRKGPSLGWVDVAGRVPQRNESPSTIGTDHKLLQGCRGALRGPERVVAKRGDLSISGVQCDRRRSGEGPLGGPRDNWLQRKPAEIVHGKLGSLRGRYGQL